MCGIVEELPYYSWCFKGIGTKITKQSPTKAGSRSIPFTKLSLVKLVRRQCLGLAWYKIINIR